MQRLTIGAGLLTARVLTYGAALNSLRLAGMSHDLTLGAPSVEAHEGALCYHGTIVGPVANRLAGAEVEIAGQRHLLEANEGRNTLHSGRRGTQARVWNVVAAEADRLILSLDLAHGACGLPGQRQITALFEALAPATLRLTLSARTDRTTLMNLANHSFWTLDGGADWGGHEIEIAAQHFLPVDDEGLPTGEVASVEGTPYDFREPRPIAPGAPPLDHCFCLSGQRRALRKVVQVRGRSGLSMTMATTEPGLQIYDGRSPARPGRMPYEGIAIEAQFWPDAPRHAAFPSILLRPGAPWHSVTEWRFELS